MTIIIYTKPTDPYGLRAQTLLRMKHASFEVRSLPEFYNEMQQQTGKNIGPQIIINGRVIGGFEELGSLDLHGELDKLL